jgi:hypothetical protein
MAHSKGIVLSLNKVLTLRGCKKRMALYEKLGNDKMFYIIGMKNKRVSEKFSRCLNDILL